MNYDLSILFLKKLKKYDFYNIARCNISKIVCDVNRGYSFADYFNVSIDYLLERTDNPTFLNK